MRNIVLIAVLLTYISITAYRLPDWDSDKNIWVSAAKTDPLDPWNLNNAANYTRGEAGINYLFQLVDLEIPAWMPLIERSPYYIGYKGFIDTYDRSDSASQLTASPIVIDFNPTVTSQRVTLNSAVSILQDSSTTAGDAATINSASGFFTKDASGSTFTLTNSLITNHSRIYLTMEGGITVTGNAVSPTTIATGSAVVTFYTVGVGAGAPASNQRVAYLVIN